MRQLRISQSITNRDSPSLDKYLAEIGRIKLISAQEEAALTKKSREGDVYAHERLTKANLRFVVSVAKQYQNNGMALCDLINEGNIGLITAAKRFDETKGFKFISYAVWWIRQFILSALAEQSRLVRLPLSQIGSLNKINKSTNRLEQQLERHPTCQELADDLQINALKITDTINHSPRSISVDALIYPGEDHTLLDVLQNQENSTDYGLMLESLSQEIKHALNILAEKERQVIVLYFGLGCYKAHSIDEISERFNLNP